jgi:hypothetical protein
MGTAGMGSKKELRPKDIPKQLKVGKSWVKNVLKMSVSS